MKSFVPVKIEPFSCSFRFIFFTHWGKKKESWYSSCKGGAQNSFPLDTEKNNTVACSAYEHRKHILIFCLIIHKTQKIGKRFLGSRENLRFLQFIFLPLGFSPSTNRTFSFWKKRIVKIPWLQKNFNHPPWDSSFCFSFSAIYFL